MLRRRLARLSAGGGRRRGRPRGAPPGGPPGGSARSTPGAVVDAFLAALAGDGAEQVGALLWRHGEMLRVERARPGLTPAGKVLHLHQERTPGPE